jgi:hypothetical protein
MLAVNETPAGRITGVCIEYALCAWDTYSALGAYTAIGIYPHILGSDLTALVERSVLLELSIVLVGRFRAS